MRLIIGMAFLAMVVVAALLRGGAPERWFAGACAAMLIVDRAGHLVLGAADQPAIKGLHVFIDLAGFAAMMILMIGARRLWPIWACSFQLLSVASHATLIMDRLPVIVPAILAVAPSYGILVSLLVGTLFHRARLKRHGSDPPWRVSWRLAGTAMPSSIPIRF